MGKLKWPTVFQFMLLTLGFIVGIYFSMKSNRQHSESHKGIEFHAPMNYGFIDISSDSIIPELKNLKVTKDSMSGWNLHFDTKNFQFTPENASKKHIAGEGHTHLIINGDKAARIYSNWFHIPELGYQIVELELTLNANSHACMSVYEKPIPIRLNRNL
ncbi:MAG: hypothetical protein JKY48_18075 [Flavobacteriales bacterium]|nr:hypothetical protein [Flavobacteriales bacterium]